MSRGLLAEAVFTPREKQQLLTLLSRLESHIERMDTETPCDLCEHFLDGKCDEWNATVPKKAQPEGCDRWKYTLPF